MRHLNLVRSIVLVLAAASACGPGVDDDTVGGTNDTSAGAETTQGTATASTTGTPVSATDAIEGSSGSSTGGPVDCYQLLTEDECTAFPECQTSRGTEALPTDVPGEYSCSDFAQPFGCAPIDCEPFTGIICSVENPDVARWLFEPRCIPGGWEPCPGDPTCV